MLKMAFFTLRPQEKTAMLISTLRDIIPAGQQTVVFVATRHHVEFLQAVLGRANIEATSVYGAMDLSARKISIGKFRARRSSVLIVTDVAARGIGIFLLTYL
jgi:ATP-dependent RNA helicase DDX54/DBP10